MIMRQSILWTFLPTLSTAIAFIGALLIFSSDTKAYAAELKIVQGNDEKPGNFGYVLRLAGDINLDGIADVISGAPSAGFGKPSGDGYARIVGLGDGYQQAVAGANPKDGEGGFSVDGAADLNCDGIAEEVAYAAPGYGKDTGLVSYFSDRLDPFQFNWQTLLGSEKGERFGHSLRLADVDLDGCADIIVASPGFGSNEGRVAAYAGKDKKVLFQLLGSKSSELGGGALDVIRHADGGTYALLVASPADDAGGNNSGSVRAYSLTPDGSGTVALAPLWIRNGIKKNSQFGSVLAADVDVDLDGVTDVVASSVKGGYVELLSGASGLVLRTWTAKSSSHFGASVSYVRDLQGDDDAIPDVLIGAPSTATVYALSSAGNQKTPLASWKGAKKDAFGSSVLGIDPQLDLQLDNGGVSFVVGAPKQNKIGALHFFDSQEVCDSDLTLVSSSSGQYQGTISIDGCPNYSSDTLSFVVSGPAGLPFQIFATNKVNSKGKLDGNAQCTSHLKGKSSAVGSGAIESSGASLVSVSLTALGIKKPGDSRLLQIFFNDQTLTSAMGCSSALQIKKQAGPA